LAHGTPQADAFIAQAARVARVSVQALPFKNRQKVKIQIALSGACFAYALGPHWHVSVVQVRPSVVSQEYTSLHCAPLVPELELRVKIIFNFFSTVVYDFIQFTLRNEFRILEG
jgi:hypothetical protein